MARFGLANRLDPKSKVYYSYLSSTRHSGRMADLIGAHFKLGGLPLFKARMFLDAASVFAFENKTQTLLIETALEGASLHFSAQFSSDRVFELGFERFQKRCLEKDVENESHALFKTLSLICDELLVVWNDDEACVEMGGVIQLEKGMNETPVVAAFERNETGAAAPAEEPASREAKQYVELGDLAYDKLLSNDFGKSSIRPPLTGDFVAKGLAEEEVKQIVKGGTQAVEREKIVVAGGKAEPEEAIVVVGSSAAGDGVSEEVERVGQMTTSILDKTQKLMEVVAEKVEPQAKTAVNNMFKELVEERSKLVERTREVNQTMKAREIEFRTKERSFTEELRRRDELLKHRSSAINHLKDQFAKLMGTVEKLKSANTQAVAKDDGFEEKYEEMRAKVEPLEAEREELSVKAEKLYRQLDEFKRVNRQLMDRISKLEKKRASPGGAQGDEMRKKMSKLMQVSEQRRLEAEVLKKQLDATRRELAEAAVRLRLAQNESGSKNDPDSSAA